LLLGAGSPLRDHAHARLCGWLPPDVQGIPAAAEGRQLQPRQCAGEAAREQSGLNPFACETRGLLKNTGTKMNETQKCRLACKLAIPFQPWFQRPATSTAKRTTTICPALTGSNRATDRKRSKTTRQQIKQ